MKITIEEFKKEYLEALQNVYHDRIVQNITATEANTAAASAGINIEFSGNTSTAGIKSYKQSIEARQQVAAGTIVTVYFRDETSVDA